MTPNEYCEDKAKKSGSSFYYSFRFLTPTQRQAITALYAFCREVDDVVDETDDVDLANKQLDEWREEVSRIFNGQPSHLVVTALAIALETFTLHEEYFIEIIDGMAMDLQQQRYQSFSQLALYCYRAASVVGLLSVEIFGYQDRKTLKYAEKLGMALQLTNIIRDVKEDAERDRIYLPLDELAKFNVSVDSLLSGETSPKLVELLKFQTERARKYYDQAMQFLPEVDRYPQRTGLIMSAIYAATLDEIEAQNFPVMEKRVSLPKLRKLWLAWQTARQEKKRLKQS